MNLRGPGDVEIASYTPEQAQSWVGEWNPNVGLMNPNDLSAVMDVNFSEDPGMFEAFRLQWEGKDPNLKFDPNTNTATVSFRRRKRWVR